MRKALIPMLASLVLCGAATGALIATNASAQGTRKPVMALVGSSALLAQNASLPAEGAGLSGVEMGSSVKDFCADRYARDVGRMAYLGVRLELSDTQRPLFERWKRVLLDAAGRGAAECSRRMALSDQERDNPVARMSREEALLKTRIADLEAERPVFASFYRSLNPGQRDLLSPPSFDRNRFFRPRPDGPPAPPL